MCNKSVSVFPFVQLEKPWAPFGSPKMPRQAESCLFTSSVRAAAVPSGRRLPVTVGRTHFAQDLKPCVTPLRSFTRRPLARSARERASEQQGGWAGCVCPSRGRQRLLGRFTRRWHGLGWLEVGGLWQSLRRWRHALGLVHDRRRRVVEVGGGAGSVLRRQIGEGDGHVLVRSVGQVRGSTEAVRLGPLSPELISYLAKKIRCAN